MTIVSLGKHNQLDYKKLYGYFVGASNEILRIISQGVRSGKLETCFRLQKANRSLVYYPAIAMGLIYTTIT